MDIGCSILILYVTQKWWNGGLGFAPGRLPQDAFVEKAN